MINALFSLLRSEICGDASSLPATLSPDELEKLYRLASAHDVAHIVGQALSKCGCLGEDDTSKQFKTAAMSAVMRYVQLQHRFEQICAALNEAKIAFIPLKGAVLRKWYPEPWMRTSCDIDILVRPNDLEKSVAVLCEQSNCTRGSTTSHDVALNFTDGVRLELHYNTIESAVSASCASVLQEIWQDAVESDAPYHLTISDAMFYTYHIAHMAKHIINGGCGIRPFLDLFVLGNIPHETEARQALIERSGLSAFANAAETLCRVWFQGEEADETSIQLAHFVLHGGSYGTMHNYVTLHRAGAGSGFRYVWSRVFLHYDVIKYYYPILQKHRWLTPLYQIVRWFKIAFGGGAKSAVYELKQNSILSDDAVHSAKTLLQQLELDV